MRCPFSFLFIVFFLRLVALYRMYLKKFTYVRDSTRK